ncbi:MAG: sugar-binding transcriptional regulator [Nocardioidaceae bacterium]
MARPREAESHGPAWLVQAGTIARRFYLDGRSKTEIADELGLSRFKVARILDDARDLGLVEVSIRLPTHIDPELSSAVQQAYGLRRAVVLERSDDPLASVRADLGRVAADLLSELATPADVLGLSCSRSVAATTASLRSLAPCRVVQLTGTLAGPDTEAGSVESVRRAASVGGGQAFPLYAPMILPDAATAAALAGDPAIAQAVRQFGGVSIAMVAIGAWGPDLSTVWQTVGAAERRDLQRAGVVGEIGARAFDVAGNAVASSLDDRVLGITLDQLRAIPEVVGLAFHADRAAAVRATLNGGLVDSLVCDADLGRALVGSTDERVTA